MRTRQVMIMINPPIPLRFDGIVRYAREHDWHLTIANRLVRPPSGWNGDGALVTLRGDEATSRFVQEMIEKHVPVVDLTYYMPDIDVARVIPDYRSAGRIAAAHFVEIGLERVVWFSTIWTKVHSLFFDGLCERWPDAEKIVLSDRIPKTKLDDVDRFANIMSARLSALPKPVGILTYNDEEATRILALCMEIGIRVPEDVAILGIGNDTFICENQPVPISSVIDDLEKNGYEAAALLDCMMSNPAGSGKRFNRASEPILVPCRGIAVRRSTDFLAVENPVLRKALAILKENIARLPSATQVAEMTGVSRSTLDRLFAAQLGRTMHDEVLRMRLSKAKGMLANGNETIYAIATACGFANPGHFVNTFRRVFGVTPAKWRSSVA